MGLALGPIDAALLAGELKPSAIHGWVEKISHLDRIRHLRIAVAPKEAVPLLRVISAQEVKTDGVPHWFRWTLASESLVVVREVRFGAESPVFIHIESYAEDEVREA